MSSTRGLSVLVLILFTITAVSAQDAATGAVRGIVVDTTGGIVPQASIVVLNVDTGRRYAATSDAAGRFMLDLSLPEITQPGPSRRACRRKSPHSFM